MQRRSVYLALEGGPSEVSDFVSAFTRTTRQRTAPKLDSKSIDEVFCALDRRCVVDTDQRFEPTETPVAPNGTHDIPAPEKSSGVPKTIIARRAQDLSKSEHKLK